MNDEIKEILYNLKVHNALADEEDTMLLNYITNLQQELEEYKDTETYSKRFLYKANKDRLNANLELVKELEDYKSRCEKAVEYIKENAKYKKISINDRKYYSEYLINQVLDTLNGRSDE